MLNIRIDAAIAPARNPGIDAGQAAASQTAANAPFARSGRVIDIRARRNDDVRNAPPTPLAANDTAAPLARLIAGAQEELNRLHNVVRQARYDVVLRDETGTVIDHRATRETSTAGTDRAEAGRARPLRMNSEIRIRHDNLSRAAAPIFDAERRLIGTLDVQPLDVDAPERPDALTRAIINAAARAIEERAFRERHRRDWIVAAMPEDASRPAILIAVDRDQYIVGADRYGFALLAGHAAALECRTVGKRVSLWALFERNATPFRNRDHGDVAAVLVPAGVPEAWSALITPPESTPWRQPDPALHARPRLEAIGSFRQLTAPTRARGGLSPGVLRRIRDHIDANLESNVNLEELAGLANLSRCHFARAFKHSIGAAPHCYVMHRRLEKAQQLLADTELPLAEIALATGFSDQSHFSRRFRERLGASPSEFRRTKR